MLLGSLEAGGTKMVLGLYNESLELIKSETIKTQSPDLTMPKILGFFLENKADALGIASFGPVDLDKSSPTYGYITSTPKVAWRNFPLLETLQKGLNIPCAIDTDVNLAAFAEAKIGAARGLDSCVYFTIGTGIGGGVLSEGRLLHGAGHPEMGHILLARHEKDTMEEGVCPYHKACAESLAAGPAIQKRFNISAEDLPNDHIAWDIEAYYLAQLCAQAVLTLSTKRIILGGGVMHKDVLFPKIRQQLKKILNGYIESPLLTDEGLESFIVPPKLYPLSGLVGGALIAKELIDKQ